MWYNFDKFSMENLVALPVDRVIEILELNKKGVKVDALLSEKYTPKDAGMRAPEFKSAVGEDSITRFDKHGNSNRNRRHQQGRDRRRGNNGGQRNEFSHNNKQRNNANLARNNGGNAPKV
jgi:hypothetical protein